MATDVKLSVGDPAPWFQQRTSTRPRFVFDVAADRYLVLCFFASASRAHARAALDAVHARRDLFDDRKAAFFGVSLDPADESEQRVADVVPGYRYFWDFDATVSQAYGAAAAGAAEPFADAASCQWVILDPTTRVIDVIAFADDRSDIARVLDLVERLPPPSAFAGFEVAAPILVLPNVFEPAFCRELVALYESHGGKDTGFMRDVDGKTLDDVDYSHKRRRDHVIKDKAVIDRTKALLKRRVSPEILKVHQFHVTRIERFIVACYDSAEAAHFRPHRDNTTIGTAHRRFAVSINLNDDFDGGEVSFPEYGRRSYKAPAGGAVVFSCSLLHAVSTVKRGRRYAFLPFLYDDAAAKIREANSPMLGEGGARYRAGG